MRTGQFPALPMQRLRVYVFDPQASKSRLDTVGVIVAKIKLPWELGR
ncbi:hypothetical protein [Rhizobium leguminosarum]|jgi:hypothetical protein